MSITKRDNPFRNEEGPIENPADFAGRGELLPILSNAMLNLRNISLHGERWTGKTSLLLYLSKKDSCLKLGLDETHIPVYISFKDLEESSANDVWRFMANMIAERIRQSNPDWQDESEQFLATVDEFLTSQKAPVLFGPAFGRAFILLEDFDLKIHLLFDDFEYTARNPDLGEPFYDTLYTLPERAENVSYLIATREGLDKLPEVTGKMSSPFFSIFTTEILKPFTEGEVCYLIHDYFNRSGLNIISSEKLCARISFIYDRTGYHPFFVQILCYHLCTGLDESDWALGQSQHKALLAFKKDSEKYFKFYWQHSSKKEQELIKNLAYNNSVDWNQIENKVIIEDLKDRCLVVQASETEDSGKLFSSVFSQWVKDNVTHGYLKPSPPLETPQGVSKRNVLLVEDDSMWHEVMRVTMDKYELDIASTYQEALNKLRKSDPYDLLIIDINLLETIQTDRLGIKLLAHIRDNIVNSPPCIVITGDPDVSIREWFKQYNVRDIFIKGHFELERFTSAVDEAIAFQVSS